VRTGIFLEAALGTCIIGIPAVMLHVDTVGDTVTWPAKACFLTFGYCFLTFGGHDPHELLG
jgi:hypothetical protein